MDNKDLLRRVDFVLQKGETALKSKKHTDLGFYVDKGLYTGFISSGLSFITDLYGEAHSYYKEFTKKSDNTYLPSAESKVHIIQSVKEEIENGWLFSYKKLITAEVFSDFLEMGKYLLDEKYKDPAAVMIGSVLEEHLRQLCATYSVDTTVVKGNDVVAKKADLLNADLVKVGAYGVLEQKNVTAWLDLRNRAAHGKYGEYVIEQVQLMYQGVLDFVSRIN